MRKSSYLVLLSKGFCLVVLLAKLCFYSSVWAGVSKTEIYIENQEQITTPVDVQHQVIKAYVASDVTTSFYCHPWTEMYWGPTLSDHSSPADLTLLGLNDTQQDYLIGLNALPSGSMYYVDVTGYEILADPNGHFSTYSLSYPGGFVPYTTTSVTGTDEVYIYEELDPLTIIITHNIITYIDESHHNYAVIAALNEIPRDTAPVPEPTTLLLLSSGFAGLAAFRLRWRRSVRIG